MGIVKIRPDRIEFYDPATDKTYEIRPEANGYVGVYDQAAGKTYHKFGKEDARRVIKRNAAGQVQFATPADARGSSWTNPAKVSAGATTTKTLTITTPADFVQAYCKAVAGTKASIKTLQILDNGASVTKVTGKTGGTVTTTITGTKHNFSKPQVKAVVKALTGAIATGGLTVKNLLNTFATEVPIW